MRHKVKSTTLGLHIGHRKAVIRNLAKQLLFHGRIKTTTTKAKYLREVVEPLITRAKSGTMHDMRQVARLIDDRDLIKKLFSEIAGLYSARNGGYTRILKLGNRAGDNAELSIIELVDFEKIYKKEEIKKDEKGKPAAAQKPKKEIAEKPKKEVKDGKELKQVKEKEKPKTEKKEEKKKKEPKK